MERIISFVFWWILSVLFIHITIGIVNGLYSILAKISVRFADPLGKIDRAESERVARSSLIIVILAVSIIYFLEQYVWMGFIWPYYLDFQFLLHNIGLGIIATSYFGILASMPYPVLGLAIHIFIKIVAYTVFLTFIRIVIAHNKNYAIEDIKTNDNDT